MKKWMFVISIAFTITVFSACFGTRKNAVTTKIIATYQKDITALAKEVAILLEKIKEPASETVLQQQFYKARLKYKQLEWFAEYYSKYTAKHINGPALEEVEQDEKSIVVAPEGFQVIEELLFPLYHSTNKQELAQQVGVLQSNIGRLLLSASTIETTDANIFDALRLEIFRIISLGISGFDSPIATHSIEEASAALQSIQQNVSLYYPDFSKEKRAVVHRLEKLFQKAEAYLSTQKDFVSFDRMAFIKEYLNPLSENLVAAQKALGIPFFTEPRALKATASTLFAKGIFNPDFYAYGTEAYATPQKIALGERLFYDVILSNDGRRSCATCHQPSKAFTDGLKTNSTLDGKGFLKRNTPTIINAALQPALFYDTRVSYLEDQANEVITNKDEMHGSLANAVIYLKGDKQYRKLFEQAYSGKDINEGAIKNALAAYIRSLVALDARFDQYMRGNSHALNKTEIKGFNLFMGKAKCGTCHFTPLFSGVNPPDFTKIDAEIIGVPASADTVNALLDADEGKYNLYKIALHKNAFKTPTLRNIALTAPYMHNGVYGTLEEVIDFYDRGGGKGLGLKIDNQTLPEEKLALTAHEKTAIISFLKTLTDTSVVRNRRAN